MFGLRTFEARRKRKARSAKQMANLTVALWNFYELGSPLGCAPLVFPRCELTDAQKSVARRALDTAEVFCASSGGAIPAEGRDRSRLNNMILSMSSKYSHADRRLQGGQAVTIAQGVDPTKISLPDEACHLDAEKLMCPERAAVFRDLSVLRKDDDQIPAKSTRPCHRIDPVDEVAFVKTLIQNKMMVLVEESEVERHPLSGALLRGGFFAVYHKAGRLRLIYDRRPLNELEKDLSPEWLTLPHGCQFTEMLLKPNEGVRGSTDDLQCWFYQLRHNAR